MFLGHAFKAVAIKVKHLMVDHLGQNLSSQVLAMGIEQFEGGAIITMADRLHHLAQYPINTADVLVACDTPINRW